ncbi:hypothetical protein RchiOBHm_Chr4g0420191 [Rosa chinensis]|uniref:Uncharacterized protein n=1 Tax=Rosa chinensis TaxID=74649 RepID=A0A2P6QXX7_ROSCH|nr:hypothetical protein RchiOBHm_Chr4g0420191 [Rosa chinensis]
MSSRALGFLRERQRISILGKDLGQSLMLYRSLSYKKNCLGNVELILVLVLVSSLGQGKDRHQFPLKFKIRVLKFKILILIFENPKF